MKPRMKLPRYRSPIFQTQQTEAWASSSTPRQRRNNGDQLNEVRGPLQTRHPRRGDHTQNLIPLGQSARGRVAATILHARSPSAATLQLH